MCVCVCVCVCVCGVCVSFWLKGRDGNGRVRMYLARFLLFSHLLFLCLYSSNLRGPGLIFITSSRASRSKVGEVSASVTAKWGVAMLDTGQRVGYYSRGKNTLARLKFSPNSPVWGWLSLNPLASPIAGKPEWETYDTDNTQIKRKSGEAGRVEIWDR